MVLTTIFIKSIKLKNSNSNTTQKLKVWMYSKTQNCKISNSFCDQKKSKNVKKKKSSKN